MSEADKKEKERFLSYTEAEKEAVELMLKKSSDIVLMGQGINDENAMFGVTDGLFEKYGTDRIFDTPLAETGLTGVAIGLAMSGYKVLYMHNRPDFLYLAMDQIINHAAKYSYMSGGQVDIPLVVWSVTGQGWGSAAQHSQNIHGIMMQVPGLKIVMPTTPADAKGLLKTAIDDKSPVLFLEHRRLFGQKQVVPEGEYEVPFGKGVLRREGTDVTVIAISAMVIDAIEASGRLQEEGISTEVIDLRTVKPYDRELLISSVSKTKRVVIADTSWITGSVAKEISEFIYRELFGILEKRIEIVALPDVPTPAAYVLEDIYYQNADSIYNAVKRLMEDKE